MNRKRILVAYGTRYGSARFTATQIDAYLKDKGYSTTLVNLRKERAPSLPGNFDFVVAGSSVAMFSWVGKVKFFLRKCRRASVPTGVKNRIRSMIENLAKDAYQPDGLMDLRDKKGVESFLESLNSYLTR